MRVPLPIWLTNATDAIRGFAHHPVPLFAMLLAMNALGRPCSVTAHDARLYSLQALNQAEQGAFADDVFLRFGSQDQFSLFSRIVGPMVATLGLRLAFLILYLVFNTLFILALFRLIRALVDDTLVSTLALVFLVTAPLTYGGYDIFMVHEQFFTPRTIGTTLTLFALERLLRQQFMLALVLLIIGASMHPLMAFGGVLIWAGYFACTFLPIRAFAGLLIASVLGSAIVLSIPMIGDRIFGSIDDEWHQMIRTAVGYNYPETWQLKDLINLTASFVLPTAGCVWLYRDDPERRRFLLIVALAGAVGFLATLAASILPYALLFQGQPYRVLWILKVLQAPLGFLLIARWAQSSSYSPKIAALALIAYFCAVHYNPQEWLIFAFALPLSVLMSRVSDEATQSGWWWYAIARGCVFGAIGWMLYRWWFFLGQYTLVAQHFDFNEWMLFDLVSPIFWLVALCVGARIWHSSSNFGSLRWASVAVALCVPVMLFTAEVSPAFQRDHTRLGVDIALVRDFVQQRSAASSRHPNIYCSLGRPDLLWIDVKATSYFDILQTAGVMFNRQTADEIERRILLVNKFEMARQRQEAILLDAGKKAGMENLFKLKFDCPEPTRDDLIRLCGEPGLDYVVIPQEYPGLYSATNGRIFIYECYRVRNICRVRERGRLNGMPVFRCPDERLFIWSQRT